jgi:hypothetical protein
MHRASLYAFILPIFGACAPPAAVVAPTPEAPGPGVVEVGDGPALPVPASFRRAVANGTRTETGRPGAGYWQQRVSYAIEAELDPASTVLRGRERIMYHNRSPEALTRIALNLYQNVFSEGVPRNRYSPVTGGMTLTRVAAAGAELPRRAWSAQEEAPGYRVQGTIGWVHLPRPVAPGDSVALEIEWHFRVPPEGTYRTAWQDAHGGRAFVVAQWYPQIATFDDLRGWDATPYLGDGEFYLEYGDFDVALTLPAGWLVGATGELRNGAEVLTDAALDRLRTARDTGGTTAIVSAADLAAGKATRAAAGGALTWRFRAENVRDFAFAASDRYVWDVRTAAVEGRDGDRRAVPVHALYRPGAANWERAAEFGVHAIEYLSGTLAPYPYPQATIAEGSVGGMEYPQMMFIGGQRTVESLYGVIAHEAVHFWFPMLVGSDEAAYAWMDEGMASFHGSSAEAALFGGADPHAGNRRSYLAVAGTEAEVPLMRHTDLVTPYGARGVAAYTKPATLYGALRAVMGAETFDEALRAYVRDWSFKHPAPWDFFNAMERAAGRDLDWFFTPWWFGTGTLDQAVEAVERVGDGTRVTVRDLGEIRMPVHLLATTSAGERHRVVIPVAEWAGGRTVSTELRAGSPVVRVEIDPERHFPDVDRDNNLWTRDGGG